MVSREDFGGTGVRGGAGDAAAGAVDAVKGLGEPTAPSLRATGAAGVGAIRGGAVGAGGAARSAGGATWSAIAGVGVNAGSACFSGGGLGAACGGGDPLVSHKPSATASSKATAKAA